MKTKHIGLSSDSPNSQLSATLSQLSQLQGGSGRFVDLLPPPPPPPTLHQAGKLSTTTNNNNNVNLVGGGLNKLKNIKTTTNGITLINSTSPNSSNSPTGRLGGQQQSTTTSTGGKIAGMNAVRIKLEQQQQQLGNLIAAVAGKSMVRLNGGGNATLAVHGDIDQADGANESADSDLKTTTTIHVNKLFFFF